MNNVLTLVGYGMFTAVLGSVYGWWIGRRSVKSQSVAQFRDEVVWAREVLTCLNGLTLSMATSVGQHSSRLKDICDELSSSKPLEPKAIAAAVAKLIQANERLEKELAASQKQLEDQARLIEAHAFEARTDALTRLANRRAFDDELIRRFDEFQRHGRPLSLVMIDIDHFKDFNDSNGHQAGDEVLRGIASVLRQKTRTMDLVARYGGEEFAIIMPGAALAAARNGGERVRKAIAQSLFRFEGKPFQITVSIGVAEVSPTENAGRLVRRADEALYAAKMAGRDSVWFHGGRACYPLRPGTETDAQGDDTTASEPAARPAAEPPQRPAGVPRRAASAEGPCETSNVWFEAALRFADRSGFCQQVRCRLAEWKRGGAAFSLLLAQIDEFQEYCDVSGSQAGETAVSYFSSVLTHLTREMDVVARYTPTCFAVLLPRTTLVDAATVASRLHEEIREFPAKSPELAPFSISVGLAAVGDGDDVVRLLQRAEAALAAAQAVGGGAIQFHNGQWTEPVQEMLTPVC